MPLAPDDAFPGLALPGLDGAPWELAEAWAGGAALVLVGHAGCRTTRQTLPYVERIHRRRGPGAGVVAVLQDDAETARALSAELGLSLPLGLDPDPYPLAAALRLATVPTLFLLGREGRIAAVSEAFRRADLEAFAERLGAPPPLFAADDATPALKPG